MTYRCTAPGCGGEITLDVGKKTQHAVYPQGKGPLSPGYQAHDCPVARGLWPPQIDKHPLAQRVR